MRASLTDAQNQTTSYVYDDYARLFQTIWPDHVAGSVPGDAGYGITQVEYDPLNRVLRTTDQLGDTVTHNYDLAGRLLSRDYRTRANSPSGTISDSDSFTNDANSNMLSAASGRYTNTVAFTYDDAGRKSSEALTISGQTYSCSTQYDSAGQVSKLIYPDASEVTRTYTARGQLETLKLGTTTIDTRTYDDGGRMTARSYNNGVSESRSYNNDNTLATINYTGASIGNLAYTWDANKNKTAETIIGVMSGYGFSAAYDLEDRLTSWQRSSSTLNQSWDLSAVGNWNSITENSVTQNRTHSPANEILTAASQAVQHDPKGNTTLLPVSLRPGSNPLSMKWDFNNKLRAADTNNDGTDDVFYLWDALGRRVGRTAGGSTMIYFQDGQQTLADYVAGASASAPAFAYLWGSYIDELVLRTNSAGNYYFHRNQQYSIIAATTSVGAIAERYAYTAYGQMTFLNTSGTPVVSSAINNRYTYTGREWDAALALYHYRARLFDPIAGRFVSRDPIGFRGSDFNLYEYCKSRSLRDIDPLGLSSTSLTDTIGHIIGLGLGGALTGQCSSLNWTVTTKLEDVNYFGAGNLIWAFLRGMVDRTSTGAIGPGACPVGSRCCVISDTKVVFDITIDMVIKDVPISRVFQPDPGVSISAKGSTQLILGVCVKNGCPCPPAFPPSVTTINFKDDWGTIPYSQLMGN